MKPDASTRRSLVAVLGSTLALLVGSKVASGQGWPAETGGRENYLQGARGEHDTEQPHC